MKHQLRALRDKYLPALIGLLLVSSIVNGQTGIYTGISNNYKWFGKGLFTNDLGIPNDTLPGSSMLLEGRAFPHFAIKNGVPYGWKVSSQKWEALTAAETDPVFTAHAAYGITGTNISNWNTAFGWDNHATAGYKSGSDSTGYTGFMSRWQRRVDSLFFKGLIDANSVLITANGSAINLRMLKSDSTNTDGYASVFQRRRDSALLRGLINTNISDILLKRDKSDTALNAASTATRGRLQAGLDSLGANYKLPSFSVDPSGLTNGRVWYNSTSGDAKAYLNGATKILQTKGDVIGSTIIYVDKTNTSATDTRTGLSKYSLDKPFLSVQGAWTAASSGDIIYVLGGTYTDSVTSVLGSKAGTFTILLFSSSFKAVSVNSNNTILNISGTGTCSVNLVQGFNGNTFVAMRNVSVQAVGGCTASSTFSDLTITTPYTLWPGVFESCDITSTYVDATYGACIYSIYTAQTFAFRNCRITHATGAFTPTTGGLSSAGGTFVINNCDITLGASFLTSRGTPTISIIDSRVSFNGFLYSHNSTSAWQSVTIINSQFTNAGTSMFNMAAADSLVWNNSTRNKPMGTLPGNMTYIGTDAYTAATGATTSVRALTLPVPYTPTSSTDATYPIGTITYDDSYQYYRTASGTWKKIALLTF